MTINTSCPHNPGSPEAVKLGCSCAVEDNHAGQGSGWYDGNGVPYFWYDYNCPLHGKVHDDDPGIKRAKDDTMLYPERVFEQ